MTNKKNTSGPTGRCGYCLEEITSTYRHDWKRCKCGKSFIDGGSEYTRCGGFVQFFNIETDKWEPEINPYE